MRSGRRRELSRGFGPRDGFVVSMCEDTRAPRAGARLCVAKGSVSVLQQRQLTVKAG